MVTRLKYFLNTEEFRLKANPKVILFPYLLCKGESVRHIYLAHTREQLPNDCSTMTYLIGTSDIICYGACSGCNVTLR